MFIELFRAVFHAKNINFVVFAVKGYIDKYSVE